MFAPLELEEERRRFQIHKAVLQGSLPEAAQAAYREAVLKCPQLISRESDPARFLREGNSIDHAAMLLARNWSQRVQFFKERAFEPLEFDNSDYPDKNKALWVSPKGQDGLSAIIPGGDKYGPLLFHYLPPDRKKIQFTALLRFRVVRCLFRMVTHISVQSKSMMVVRFSDSLFVSVGAVNFLSIFLESMPIELDVFHAVYIHPPGAKRIVARTLLPNAEITFGPYVVQKLQNHLCQTYKAAIDSLTKSKHGLSANSIPSFVGGKLILEPFKGPFSEQSSSMAIRFFETYEQDEALPAADVTTQVLKEMIERQNLEGQKHQQEKQEIRLKQPPEDHSKLIKTVLLKTGVINDDRASSWGVMDEELECRANAPCVSKKLDVQAFHSVPPDSRRVDPDSSQNASKMPPPITEERPKIDLSTKEPLKSNTIITKGNDSSTLISIIPPLHGGDTKEERKMRKRLIDVVYARERRQREKDEEGTLTKQYAELKMQNIRMLSEQKMLKRLLENARKVVDHYENGTDYGNGDIDPTLVSSTLAETAPGSEPLDRSVKSLTIPQERPSSEHPAVRKGWIPESGTATPVAPKKKLLQHHRDDSPQAGADTNKRCPKASQRKKTGLVTVTVPVAKEDIPRERQAMVSQIAAKPQVSSQVPKREQQERASLLLNSPEATLIKSSNIDHHDTVQDYDQNSSARMYERGRAPSMRGHKGANLFQTHSTDLRPQGQSLMKQIKLNDSSPPVQDNRVVPVQFSVNAQVQRSQPVLGLQAMAHQGLVLVAGYGSPMEFKPQQFQGSQQQNAQTQFVIQAAVGNGFGEGMAQPQQQTQFAARAANNVDSLTLQEKEMLFRKLTCPQGVQASNTNFPVGVARAASHIPIFSGLGGQEIRNRIFQKNAKQFCNSGSTTNQMHSNDPKFLLTRQLPTYMATDNRVSHPAGNHRQFIQAHEARGTSHMPQILNGGYSGPNFTNPQAQLGTRQNTLSGVGHSANHIVVVNGEINNSPRTETNEPITAAQISREVLRCKFNVEEDVLRSIPDDVLPRLLQSFLKK